MCLVGLRFLVFVQRKASIRGVCPALPLTFEVKGQGYSRSGK